MKMNTFVQGARQAPHYLTNMMSTMSELDIENELVSSSRIVAFGICMLIVLQVITIVQIKNMKQC